MKVYHVRGQVVQRVLSRACAAGGPRWAAVVLASSVLAASPASAQSPERTSDPGFEAAMAALELMNMAPPGILETCTPSEVALDGARASAQCLSGDDGVLYVSFRDLAALQVAYDQIAGASGVGFDTGGACSLGLFEGTYEGPDGDPSGRLLCQLTTEGMTAVWTDEGNLVLGVIVVDAAAAYPTLEAAWQGARIGVAPPPEDAAVGASTAAAPASGDKIGQFAIAASASSEYGTDRWGAVQATGAPDVDGYGDNDRAWAPSGSEVGSQWLELLYEIALVPSFVVVWETSGNGFVTSIEGWDVSYGWVTLWEGVDDSPDERTGFAPPLKEVTFATDRLRVTVDTSVPGWNEIDAVEFVGIVP